MIEVCSSGAIANTSKVRKMLDYLNNPHKYDTVPVGLATITRKMTANGFDPALFPKELQQSLSSETKKTFKAETVENKQQPQGGSVLINTPRVEKEPFSPQASSSPLNKSSYTPVTQVSSSPLNKSGYTPVAHRTRPARKKQRKNGITFERAQAKEECRLERQKNIRSA